MKRLRELREERAHSQRSLAAAAGVSAGTIFRLEAGYAAYPVTARKLAAALGVEPRELYETTKPKPAGRPAARYGLRSE